jgi:hypothetical protein
MRQDDESVRWMSGLRIMTSVEDFFGHTWYGRKDV